MKKIARKTGAILSPGSASSHRRDAAAWSSCAIPSEVDRERQRSDVGLEIAVHLGIRVREPYESRIDARRGEHPPREPRRQPTVASDGNVEDFEFGARADALRMSSTTERPVLLGCRIRLHQENSFDDLLDVRLFPGGAPLSVAAGHSEPSSQEEHDS